jgi:hypothetical protein
MLLDDLFDGDEGDLPSSENITSTPSDWDNVSPNQVQAEAVENRSVGSAWAASFLQVI